MSCRARKYAALVAHVKRLEARVRLLEFGYNVYSQPPESLFSFLPQEPMTLDGPPIKNGGGQ